MKKLLLALILTLTPFLVSAEERVFSIREDTHAVWTKIVEKVSKEKPPTILPNILFDADLSIDLKAMPKQGYYKGQITLLKRYKLLLGFTKSIELWNKGDHTVVRTRVEIEAVKLRFPLRFVNRLIDRILYRVELSILDMEEAYLDNLLLRNYE